MAAQQKGVVATSQPQLSVVITTTPVPAGGEINKVYQAKLRGLAITELMIGSLCFIIGAAISGIIGSEPSFYSFRYYGSYSFAFTTGEGIWCGIWIIVAGALGVRAAMPFASKCLITTHMAFSIVASVFSGVMLGISLFVVCLAGSPYDPSSLTELFSILCVISFVSMILLIISASYCCKTLRCCCSDAAGQGCGCCMAYDQRNTYGGDNIVYAQQAPEGQAVGNPHQQTVYAQQPGMAGQPVAYTQQPTMAYQSASDVPQGYVIQGARPMVQPGFQGAVVQPNQGVANQGVQNPEKAQQGFGAYDNTPPSYQSLQ